MKKRLLSIAFVSAIAVTAGWNFAQSENKGNLSDLAMTNVEALAASENPMCSNGCLDNGNGCFCNYWFPTYKEAQW